MQIKKLGDFLKERQLVEEDELIHAVHLAKKHGKKVGQVLLETGALTEDDLLKAIGDQLGFNIVSLANYPIDPKVVSLISREVCEEKLCVPLKFDENNSLHVAMKDVSNAELVQYLKFSTGKNIIASIALESEIRNTIGRLYDFAASLEDLVNNVSKLNELELVDPEHEADAADARSYTVTQIVKSVLGEAVAKGASDIHMEPSQTFLRVRIRIDGQLQNLINIPKWVQSQVIGCIKVQASLNIAEKRVPQDGKLSANVAGRHVDFRVSTLPTPQGEKVVIRIQDKGNKGYSLSSLSLPPYLLKQILRLLQNDKGIILVTGPTGSGKTTLLYSMLTELARRGPNIITVEDPIEYEFEGITQTQINEKAGMTFSTILRSILRQDPNVIMIGEIRDQETAEIAFRAAQTGHLVLSTLHTNSAVSVVTRLKDLGIEPFLIASTVLGIFAQRLVRCNCPKCAGIEDTSHVTDPTQKKLLELLPARTSLMRGQGCESCGDSGYRGRVGVYEYLRFSPGVVDAVNGGLPEKQILQAAKADGMKTLVDECVRLISEGTTSFTECSGILATLDMTEAGHDPHAEHTCPSCNKPVSAEFVTCPYCEYRLVCKCPKCDSHVERDWQVCPYCSEQLVSVQPLGLAAAPPGVVLGGATKPLVLIVDEKEAMRRALGIILGQIGCEVVESTNGEEALELAGNVLPNLIIADFDTPRINGSKLFHTLRERAATSAIPFILLTQGGGQEADMADILEDVDGHLGKPFNYRELQAKVKKLLGPDSLRHSPQAAASSPVVASPEKPAPPAVKRQPEAAPAKAPTVPKVAAPTPAKTPTPPPAAAPLKATTRAAPAPLREDIAPAAPGGLSATPAKSRVDLAFSAAAEGVAVNAYQVEITPLRSTPIVLKVAAENGAKAAKGRVEAILTAKPGQIGISITGLINGKQHSFAVTAFNAAGSSASAAAIKATPAGVPDSPAISGVSAGNASATVGFTAPASHNGSFLSGYTVISNPPGGVDRDAGSLNLTHTVTGLVNGQPYTFTVVAANGVGSSAPSAPSADVTPLAVPRVVDFNAVAGNTKVHLVFATPADPGNLPTLYTVTVSGAGREDVPLSLEAQPGATAAAGGLSAAVAVNGGRTAITIGNLVNGQAYGFKLSAANSAGLGEVSTRSGVIPATLPGAPTISAVKAADRAAQITLSPPAADGGSVISGYVVTSIPPGGVDQDAGSVSLTHTVNGLENGVSYTFSAVAANAVGSGPASPVSAPVIPLQAPPALVCSAAPGNAEVTLAFPSPADKGSLPTRYTLSVGAPGEKPVALNLNVAPAATATSGGISAAMSLAAGKTRIVVKGLQNGVPYSFTLVAANSAGVGKATPALSCTPATVPGAPAFAALQVGNGEVTITLSAPDNDGGCPITAYMVKAVPPDGVDSATDTTSLVRTLTGLNPATSYTFTAVAINRVGSSAPSGVSGAVVPSPPPDIGKVTATAGKSQVALTFALPPGAPPSAYAVEITPARAAGPILLEIKGENGASVTHNGVTATLVQGGSNARITVMGLINGKAHDFVLSATNPVGKGAPSAPIRAVPATVPSAPQTVSAKAADTHAHVEFAPPASHGGSFISGYTVISDPPGGIDEDAGTLLTTHKVSGLHSGVSYTFSVYAGNAMGKSPLSAPSPRVVPFAPPPRSAGQAELDEEQGESELSSADSWIAALESGGAGVGMKDER